MTYPDDASALVGKVLNGLDDGLHSWRRSAAPRFVRRCLASFRRVLLRHNYSEAAATALVGSPAAQGAWPRIKGEVVEAPRRGVDVRAAALLGTFLLNATVAAPKLEEVLGSVLISDLQKLGVLWRPSPESGWQSTVQLAPVDVRKPFAASMFFFVDWDELRPWHQVMTVTIDSYALLRAQALLPLQAAPKRVLDLCAGSGVQGLYAAKRFAAAATLVDLNPRAVRFAKANVLLNQVSKVTLHHGNLFEALPNRCRDEIARYSPTLDCSHGLFDLILANPPYVPSTGGGQMFVSGGDRGEDVTARILRGAPKALGSGGRLLLVANLANVDGNYQAKLRRWWNPRQANDVKLNMSADVLHGDVWTPEAYAAGFIGSDMARASFRRLLRSSGVTSMTNGFVFVKALRELGSDLRCHGAVRGVPGLWHALVDEAHSGHQRAADLVSHVLTESGIACVHTLEMFASALHVSENGNQRAQSFDLATCCTTATQAVGAIVLGCEPQDLACFLGSYAVNRLRAPTRIDAMNDELFIADTDNHRVLRVSNSSVEVVSGTTGIAGCRPEQLRSPQGVATDSSGFLYVADTGNHRIQKFAVAAGDRIGLTVAGECCCPSVDGGGIPLGGSGLHELDGPRGLVIDVATGALVVADTGNQRVLAFGGVGYEQRRAPGASCAYGVSCSVRLFGAVALSAQQSQVVIVKRDVADPSSSPCGSINCSFAHWPGVTNPQLVGGQFFDTYDLGMPHGPPNSSVSGLGEYAICWSEAPSTACVGYPCSEDNSCSNGTAWLCNGAQPLGLVRKVWHNLPGKTLADLLAVAAFPDSPDLEEFATALTSAANYGDNYGQMFYGLFVAPETGSYVFEITSDENSELRISDAFNDTQGQVVAYISEAQTWYQGPFLRQGYAPGPDAWDSFPTQSGSYYMEAGHLYYLEVLHKERVQSDHLIAGVRLPSGIVHRPIPASFFDAVVCTQGFPVGLAVVHDCTGRKTGQSCTAQCRGGWSGAQQTFVCDGVGILHGRDPVCTAVQCEEYSVEVGSLFMHGVWDEVDCSNMEGIKCDDQLRSWSGPENCASRVVTAGNSCRDYCLARGRGCVKSSAMTLQLHGRQLEEINCPCALPGMPVCHNAEKGELDSINLLAAGQLKYDSLATNLYGSLTIACWRL
ncbi:prmB [Symbiodinium sp. CCMP2592]|nr:prmB [Symbiodinium sp. CCMP2592]